MIHIEFRPTVEPGLDLPKTSSSCPVCALWKGGSGDLCDLFKQEMGW